MDASEDNSLLFLGFILTLLVPYTILKIYWAVARRTKAIHHQQAARLRSAQICKPMLERILHSSLTPVLLLVVMGVLLYTTEPISQEVKQFNPFSILGIEPGASDADIKKAYRRLALQFHPDKNPDPEANKYFVECISKAYLALTNPMSHVNYEKHGHPDGKQVDFRCVPRMQSTPFKSIS